MGSKLLKTVQTITTFRNPLADPVGTRRGPPLVRGPQFENRCITQTLFQQIKSMLMPRGPRNLTGDLFSRRISKRFGYLRKSINIVRKYEKNPRI